MIILVWIFAALVGIGFIACVVAASIASARESRETDSADCGACEGLGREWWAE